MAIYTVSTQLCHQETGLIMLALQLTVSFTETKGREKTLNGLSLYQNCYVMLLPKRPFPVFVLMDIINNIGGLGKGWGVTIYLDGSFKTPS